MSRTFVITHEFKPQRQDKTNDGIFKWDFKSSGRAKTIRFHKIICDDLFRSPYGPSDSGHYKINFYPLSYKTFFVGKGDTNKIGPTLNCDCELGGEQQFQVMLVDDNDNNKYKCGAGRITIFMEVDFK